MKITITAKPKEVKPGHFNYSNIESVYGANTQYFTKNGKPFTVIAGELHFSRLPKERWRETLLKMRDLKCVQRNPRAAIFGQTGIEPRLRDP